MLEQLRWAVPVLALALLVSACSGESSTTTTSTPETTTTSIAVETVVTTTTEPPIPENTVATGIGVDPETKVISLGLLADLTGLFSSLESDVTAAQTVYWDVLNDAGGIEGWTIRYVVEDTKSNAELHLEKYEAIRDEVAAISLSTGSDTNVAALDRYVEDSMLVIPLSWYSGWAIPRFDRRVMLEQNANYCIEAMNILDFIDEAGGKTIALASFDGVYGQDAAAGVRKAVEFYGMELVFDGGGLVVPGQDLTPIIQNIVESEADWTFMATNPSIGAEILAGAARAGYEGMFTGSVPTYDFRLLDQPAAPLYAERFYQSAFHPVWGTDTEGMDVMANALIAAYPDRRPSDAFVAGWNEAVMMHRVLATALEARDLTRAGIVAAANSIDETSFAGTAPDQSYAGTPNDYVQRSTAIYKPDIDLYLAAGGADQALSDPDGTTGSRVVKDFFVGDMARDFDFLNPCFVK